LQAASSTSNTRDAVVAFVLATAALAGVVAARRGTSNQSPVGRSRCRADLDALTTLIATTVFGDEGGAGAT
jgi:hypothetical protein